MNRSFVKNCFCIKHHSRREIKKWLIKNWILKFNQKKNLFEIYWIYFEYSGKINCQIDGESIESISVFNQDIKKTHTFVLLWSQDYEFLFNVVQIRILFAGVTLDPITLNCCWGEMRQNSPKIHIFHAYYRSYKPNVNFFDNVTSLRNLNLFFAAKVLNLFFRYI